MVLVGLFGPGAVPGLPVVTGLLHWGTWVFGGLSLYAMGV